ncbi:MAG: HlyD family efflux transporter periplasmic adaptor subunit [Immundisolibacteraceae bacterium]|nr:HlyD family efflux transporter periplasmic adaptor subunit [Immundisolibacteraceae bacterium]
MFQTYVAEKRVSALAVGQKIAVELDALERPLNGEVLRIVPSGDPVTRRFEIKVSLPNTLNLLPGMFGRARFVIGATNRVLVARSMMVERGGLVGVMAIVDDHAEFRWLRIGQQWPAQVEVIGGLDEGELIVADPADDLFDGALLTVVTKQ